MINITFQNTKKIVKVASFIDGKAYIEADSTDNTRKPVYIANQVRVQNDSAIVAFSLCGNYVIRACSNKDYQEVDLDVNVKSI